LEGMYMTSKKAVFIQIEYRRIDENIDINPNSKDTPWKAVES